jgi:hypothetical protein
MKRTESIWSIINGIAWQQGISNPKVLEGGRYQPEHARVLRRMAKKFLKSKSAHDFYLYIKQKARFLITY